MFATTPFLTPKMTVKNQKFFCFSDRSYRNRTRNRNWGHLEAILRVLEVIFGRGGGVEHPPVPNKVNKICLKLA